MAVTHVLSDGTILKDITGHVVKKEEVPLAYAVVEQTNRKENKDGNNL